MRHVVALVLAVLPSCREHDATPAASSTHLASPPATSSLETPTAAISDAGVKSPAPTAVDAGASADGGAVSDAGAGTDVCMAAWQAAEEGRCEQARHAYWRCTQEPHGGKSETALAARSGIMYRCQKDEWP